MNDIDRLLKPYEDDQPDNLSMSSDKFNIIERIPRIVNGMGPTDEFQTFYNELVDAITSSNIEKLYEMSDKAIDKENFTDIYKDSIDNHIKSVIEMKSAQRGLDIELNLSRFKELHRNLVGGFLILTYTLESGKFDTNQNDFNLTYKYTEVLFSYKNGEFVVLSCFKPFKVVEN